MKKEKGVRVEEQGEREGKKRNFAPFAATGFGPSSPNAAKGLADMIRCPFKN